MKIHLIGIGGSIMHNLALVLQELGHTVTGSDNVIYEPAKTALENAGLLPAEEGWFESKITSDIDIVILGMTALYDNIEWEKAKELGLRILSYPDYIYEHARNKKRVVVAGSHGKTTTTAMIMHVLDDQGIDFDYLVGSSLEGFERSVRLTDEAPIIIIEGDEYLDSKIDNKPKILKYHHDIGIINGIARDHMNVFPTYDSYLNAFRDFFHMTREDGVVYWNQEDSEVTRLVEEHLENCGVLGDYRAYKALPYDINGGIFVVNYENKNYPMKIFGHHNMINMSAAHNVCKELGISSKQFFVSMQGFSGTMNRLTLLVENKKNNYYIYRDFAHAPSKVRATVDAVKAKHPNQKIYAFFELHTYSSLNPKFLPQYEGTLEKADKSYLFYEKDSSIKKNLNVLDERTIKETFGADISVLSSHQEVEQIIHDIGKKDCVLLLMSSGHFGGLTFG